MYFAKFWFFEQRPLPPSFVYVVGTRPKNDLLVGNVDACVSGVGCVAHRKQIYSTIALSEPGNLKRLFN